MKCDMKNYYYNYRICILTILSFSPLFCATIDTTTTEQETTKARTKSGTVLCEDHTRQKITALPDPNCQNCPPAFAACADHKGIKPGSWPTYCNLCPTSETILKTVTCRDNTKRTVQALPDPNCQNCINAQNACSLTGGGVKPTSWPLYCTQCIPGITYQTQQITCADTTQQTALMTPEPSCQNCINAQLTCTNNGGIKPGVWPHNCPQDQCSQVKPKLVECFSGSKFVIPALPDPNCQNCSNAKNACAQESGLREGNWPDYCGNCPSK